MERYEPETHDGTLSLVGDGDRVEVGSLDDVVAAVGGATYTIEYDERQRKQPWLDTDDGRLDVDVRDAVTSLKHTPELVDELRDHDLSTERYGLPERTVVFADRFVDILERQGREHE
ncbi:hypothetical protein [Halomarina oriensis]|uniref:Uncharacterized protein n=1 Tax=Halomarina oriensis TaxID=671145 RepID=A0A6B0GL00_9EURY|nr:hypothetical protein [Halomarina oriensis]MWG33473.1 hypothetical protein [Halomarina oriensis]